jgi:hypothetical protein
MAERIQYIPAPHISGVLVGGKVCDGTDQTKEVSFDVSGVTTATTRTVTFPDANIVLGETASKEMRIPIDQGIADGGTYTVAITTGGLITVTRTAADAADSYWVSIPIGNNTTASKGIKPTGLKVNYTVDTADAEDIRCELWKVTQGADDAARTAAVIFGDADGDYDAAHDTAAERGDDTTNPELHLATVTDAGTPAYLGAGESLLFRFYCDGAATSDIVLTDAVLVYTEAPV